jgi:hypothetical protein
MSGEDVKSSLWPNDEDFSVNLDKCKKIYEDENYGLKE